MTHFSSTLDKLQAGQWIDPESGQTMRSPIEQVMIGSIRSNMRQLVGGLDWDVSRLVVVCDNNTHKVLGAELGKCLGVETYVLPGNAQPSMEVIQQLEAQLPHQSISGMVAVGSGTLNDICKYISFRKNIPYAVWATAPSMNGYASVSASVIQKDYRTSVRTHYPKAIFMDVDILSQAPKRLIRSGVGDSLCRVTAQVDWLMSHKLIGTSYDLVPFLLLQADEQRLLRQIEGVMKTDESAIQTLASLLVLSGIGMTLANGSYPASQGEHMIAHTMEMVSPSVQRVYHGESIAITTLTMLSIQQKWLDTEWTLEDMAIQEDEKEIQEKMLGYFGKSLAKQCMAEYREKYELLKENQYRFTDTLYTGQVRCLLKKIAGKEREYKEIFEQIGAPTKPEDVGWDRLHYRRAITMAKYTRDRLTFLDLGDAVLERK